MDGVGSGGGQVEWEMKVVSCSNQWLGKTWMPLTVDECRAGHSIYRGFVVSFLLVLRNATGWTRRRRVT